jgi:outer membrane biosynthesis protein TonB
MRTGLVVSVGVHAVLLVLGLVSLGWAEPLQPEAVDSISVDLVPMTDTTNIRVGSLDSEVVETPTPSAVKDDTPAELAQPTGNTEQDQPVVQDSATPAVMPTNNTAPEPQPEPEPQPKPTPTPVEPDPTPVQPVDRAQPDPEPQPEPVVEPLTQPEPEPQPDPQPTTPDPELATPTEPLTPAEVAPQPVERLASLEEKRAQFAEDQKKQKAAEEKKKKDEEAKRVAEAEAKKKEQQQADAAQQAQSMAALADDISAIINKDDSHGATTGKGGDPTLGKETGTSASLSQSELDALVAQIKICLSVPLGAIEAGATAQVQIDLNRDGSVAKAQIISQPANTIEQAYANAAVRAVTSCGPYTMLSAATYDQWQQVGILFDPSQM